ncbi:MAG: hypothetical protein BWY17_04958 [Deltaproteobacteria bacterium ADurb.Bin207]|nr:MAG: hypothetical protein BWY17_04958 [Deltaproteobacteria bacterium ADurb.Bin207]
MCFGILYSHGSGGWQGMYADVYGDVSGRVVMQGSGGFPHGEFMYAAGRSSMCCLFGGWPLQSGVWRLLPCLGGDGKLWSGLQLRIVSGGIFLHDGEHSGGICQTMCTECGDVRLLRGHRRIGQTLRKL